MADDSSGSGVKRPQFGNLPALRIRSDILRVGSTAMTMKGEKLEPEAQPAQRVMMTDAAVSMRGSGQIGSIPTEIVADGTAGEFANAMRSKCFTCKNFDAKAWTQLRLYWGNSSDKDLFEKLNKVRYALLTTQNPELSRRSEGMDGDFDVEHSVSQLGLCKPMTEMNQDPVIVSPISTCPDQVCTPSNPSGLYVPKDREHERLGSSAYDKIMRMATGRPADHSIVDGGGILLGLWVRLKPLFFEM